MGQWPASAMACTAKYTAEIDNALETKGLGHGDDKVGAGGTASEEVVLNFSQ